MKWARRFQSRLMLVMSRTSIETITSCNAANYIDVQEELLEACDTLIGAELWQPHLSGIFLGRIELQIQETLAEYVGGKDFKDKATREAELKCRNAVLEMRGIEKCPKEMTVTQVYMGWPIVCTQSLSVRILTCFELKRLQVTAFYKLRNPAFAFPLMWNEQEMWQPWALEELGTDEYANIQWDTAVWPRASDCRAHANALLKEYVPAEVKEF